MYVYGERARIFIEEIFLLYIYFLIRNNCL